MSRRGKRPKDKPGGSFLRPAWWIIFLSVLVTTLCIRIHLLGVPLERDEGEYAYAGQLLLEGIPPYQLAYNMKFPGTYAAYAVIMFLFGQSPVGVHLGLLFVNLATILSLYLIGRRLFREAGALAAASAYAILSLTPSVLGFAGHATHYILLPAMGGILLLLRPAEKRSLPAICGSGALFGLATLMKQPGLYFAIFGGLYLLWADWRAHLSWRKIVARGAILTLGVVSPAAIAFYLLWQAGVLGTFWFWTVDYARAYAGINSLNIGRQYLVRSFPAIVSHGWLLWLLAGIGVTACFWQAKARHQRVFLLGLLGTSFLAVSAGLYFREHYFILLLPAVSLLAAGATVALTDLIPARYRLAQVVPLLLFCVALALTLFGNRDLFFSRSIDSALRKVWWTNPFLESIPISTYVRDHTRPSDTIAVLGSEPQIYFYAHRHSATGYIYTYNLMETHRFARQMQEEMIREIEAARPKLIVFVSIDRSWLVLPHSDRMVLDWVNTYLKANYTGVGLVNVFPDKPANYYLPLESAPPQVSPSRILIYERNN